jgi:ATP-dependent Clp protease ATP-binding subunit ClpC
LGSLDIPEPPPFTDQQPTAKDKRKQNALDFFATNLTNENAQKTIDPVIGRDTEIERLIHILCRRTKNNPILLGDPGVGKTAIVEGLAKKILSGDVPDLLLNKKIYALDLGMLIAGTIYRGEFEARLRQVIEEVLNNPDIILFIDELHNIVGTGSNQGTMDAANILKPALARGHIRCIGATTPGEFKKYIESDPALERRFQPIFVKEPSLTDTVKIIQGIKINYEAYHNVHITDEAIVAAVELSDRYISNKFLPDKAIDVIDETAAAKRLTVKMQPWQNKLVRTKQKLEKIILAKEQAAAQDKFSEAVKLKDEEEKLRSEIKKIEKMSTTKKIKAAAHVDVQDIYQQIAKITGVSPTELLLDKPEQFDVLTQKLKEYIVGQDTVIETVARLIRQAQLGLSHPERPLASFLFVGESGVGKTELAKTLAKLLYPGSDALIKLDMSEFNESFGVSKLLGSPAGYIGYKESNQFTDRIKMNPHCIILFDEIDKAHRDVIKLLLQILENGEITDSTGRKISLKHAIIIMTTSLGAEDVKRGIIGFSERDTHALTPELVSQLTEKLKDHFSPEVINRIDRICIFNPLSHDQLIKLAELELVKFNERLKNHHTSLEAQPDIFEWFIKQLPEKQRGARDIRRLVREKSENLIADLILKRKIKPHYELVVKDNELSLK